MPTKMVLQSKIVRTNKSLNDFLETLSPVDVRQVVPLIFDHGGEQILWHQVIYMIPIEIKEKEGTDGE